MTAAIWVNEREQGPRFNVTFERLYREGDTWALVDHYGDGAIRPTFEEAQEFVLTTTGVFLRAIPERMAITPPETGEWSLVVATFVREFAATDKSREEVEEDSFIKSVGKYRGDGTVTSTLVQ